MNHCVPDFNMDEDYALRSSSGTPSSSQPKKPSTGDEDIMELLWHNGQLVMQNQSQRLPKRSSPTEQNSSQQQLFMHEDEMCSWLHYPLVEESSSFDQNFCADLLYPPPPVSSNNTASTTSTTTVVATVSTITVPERTIHVGITDLKPPPKSPGGGGGRDEGGYISKQSMPPPLLFNRVRSEPGPEPSVKNFGLFSRYKDKARAAEPGPYSTKAMSAAAAAPHPNTVVDSNDTPTIGEAIKHNRSVEAAKNVMGSSAGCSSPLPSGSSASGEQGQKQPVEDRKRKGREVEEAEGQSEDIEFEPVDTKKLAGGSTSSKRTRAAEVHNLSERRRRDRINEKMRALQELIPRCNKSDKASMLDEAIEYLKSLQLQVQMMSMGYGMVPMMYPGIQQYMPPMGMGMGMNLEIGMNRPMMPYPNVFPSSAYPTSGASAHMGPHYPMPLPPFHMPSAALQDPSRYQTIQSGLTLNSGGASNPISPCIPLHTDPYQQFIGLPQMQQPLPQNQVMALASNSKPGSSGTTDVVENPKSG